jgi:lysophospholipase L1-like esterase
MQARTFGHTTPSRRATLVGTAVLVGLVSLPATLPAAPPSVTLEAIGPWRVRVVVRLPDGPREATLDVSPPDIVTVVDERHAPLAEFNPQGPPWRKGPPLAGVRAEECSVRGAVDPESVVVKDAAGAGGRVLARGADYEADLDWGSFGRLPGGGIAADQPVFVSYRYCMRRLDSIVLGADGTISLRPGRPQVATCEPPPLAAGETRLANVFIPGRVAALTADCLYPILETEYPEPPRPEPSVADTLLPATMRRLRSGEPLKVLAWGDSVTTYGRWQSMFVDRLRQRFPAARIELVTEAWGGRNTGSYLAEPPGSEHNYREKVLDRRPDLVVSEFVNDAGLSPEQVEDRYGRLLADFRGIGAEWIILTPHYVMPAWMKLQSQREIDDDPRPYVQGVREFGRRHGVAVADASLRYGRLWRRGIPYQTLMENDINHPNVFGHSLFADSLLALFP